MAASSRPGDLCVVDDLPFEEDLVDWAPVRVERYTRS